MIFRSFFPILSFRFSQSFEKSVLNYQDTIFALSTGLNKAGISVKLNDNINISFICLRL